MPFIDNTWISERTHFMWVDVDLVPARSVQQDQMISGEDSCKQQDHADLPFETPPSSLWMFFDIDIVRLNYPIRSIYLNYSIRSICLMPRSADPGIGLKND